MTGEVSGRNLFQNSRNASAGDILVITIVRFRVMSRPLVVQCYVPVERISICELLVV